MFDKDAKILAEAYEKVLYRKLHEEDEKDKKDEDSDESKESDKEETGDKNEDKDKEDKDTGDNEGKDNEGSEDSSDKSSEDGDEEDSEKDSDDKTYNPFSPESDSEEDKDSEGEGNEEGSEGDKGIQGKVENLKKQYNDIIAKAFADHAQEAIDGALEGYEDSFGENIQGIIDNALANLKNKVLADLGVECGACADMGGDPTSDMGDGMGGDMGGDMGGEPEDLESPDQEAGEMSSGLENEDPMSMGSEDPIGEPVGITSKPVVVRFGEAASAKQKASRAKFLAMIKAKKSGSKKKEEKDSKEE